MNVNEKSQLLFECIGEINDDLIHEAEEYKPKKKRSYNFALIAACFALVMVLALASPLLRVLIGMSNEATDQPVTLDSVLLDSKDSGFETVRSPESLDYVGGASLVWQYEESGEYYVARLSQGELVRLTQGMGRGEEVGERSPELSCRVWVLDGRGNVTSPYLKEGRGNDGCTVFDYEAEIIPDEMLVEQIFEILN